MKQSKQQKLAEAGWRVGAFEAFLSLSREEALLIELKLALVREVRTQRRSKSLTQSQLADLINSSQSRIAKMEAGDPSVSTDLLLRTLFALGRSTDQIAELFRRRQKSKQATRF
jgi:DNA-binding XRE family transcriptional regulator